MWAEPLWCTSSLPGDWTSRAGRDGPIRLPCLPNHIREVDRYFKYLKSYPSFKADVASQNFGINYSQLRAVELLKFTETPTLEGRAGFPGLCWDTADFTPPWKLPSLCQLMRTTRRHIQLLMAVNQESQALNYISHIPSAQPRNAGMTGMNTACGVVRAIRQQGWFSLVNLSWFPNKAFLPYFL